MIILGAFRPLDSIKQLKKGKPRHSWSNSEHCAVNLTIVIAFDKAF